MLNSKMTESKKTKWLKSQYLKKTGFLFFSVDHRCVKAACCQTPEGNSSTKYADKQEINKYITYSQYLCSSISIFEKMH